MLSDLKILSLHAQHNKLTDVGIHKALTDSLPFPLTISVYSLFAPVLITLQLTSNELSFSP